MKTSSVIYLAVHFLPIIIYKMKQFKKEPSKVLQRAIKNLTLSVLFLSTQIQIVRSGYCISNKIAGRTTRPASTFAFFLAAMGVLWESAHRRNELSLYLAPKFIEGIQGFLIRRGLAKSFPYQEFFTLAFSFGLIGVGAFKDNNSLKSLYRSIFKALWE